jgi:acetyltransferase-like isoleucine patch superfamily enzyme
LVSGIRALLQYLLTRVRPWLRSRLFEEEEAKIEQWRRHLSGNLSLGAGANVRDASLVVHTPLGCSIRIGAQSDVHAAIHMYQPHVQLTIGARTHVGWQTRIDLAAGLNIGDDVLIGWEVLLMDHDAHSLRFSERKDDVVHNHAHWERVKKSPITIQDKCWIGARATILKGVCLGEGAIVGVASVVTRDVPPWTVVAGNPARIIRELTEEERS